MNIKPWKHQKEAVSLAMQQKATLLHHDMGCGKTISSILLAQSIQAKKVLIIAPKSVLSVWTKEFKKFCNDEFMVEFFTKGTVIAKAEKIKLFLASQQQKKKVVVINYESAWRDGLGPKKVNGRENKPGLLREIDWDLVIYDEAHKLCGSSSKISKFARKLSVKARKVLALTGTPLPNGCLSAHGLFRALDHTIFGDSEYRFKMKYAVMGGFENREVVDYVNQEEFQKKFASITHTVKAEDVIELPDVTHQTIEVELSPKAMKIYNEFKEECIVEFDNGQITAENILVKYLRLAMIASGSIKDEDGNIHNIDNSKIEALKDIIDGVPKHEPVVVFARFKDEIKRAKEALIKDGYTCSELSGSINELADWQENKTQILLMNIQAGSVGIDCTRARFCIYLSTGYSYVMYKQSLARCCRPGADLSKKIRYYHINAVNTIDIKITRSLMNKKDVIETLLEDISKHQRSRPRVSNPPLRKLVGAFESLLLTRSQTLSSV
jgi:SNF2 family DNA or RNA helicase